MRHMWQSVMYQETVLLSWKKLTCGWGNCNTCHKIFDNRIKGNIHIQKMHIYVHGGSKEHMNVWFVGKG